MVSIISVEILYGWIGMKCILSGWGKHGKDEHMPGDLYGQPWTLRQATLPLMSDEECRVIYQVSPVILKTRDFTGT